MKGGDREGVAGLEGTRITVKTYTQKRLWAPDCIENEKAPASESGRHKFLLTLLRLG